MGIKQEIEQLRSAEQSRRDEETKRKKGLIRKIETTEERLWSKARGFAAPFAQKLQESGVVKILDELRKEEDLRANAAEWQGPSFFHLEGFYRKDPRPAVVGIVFEVRIDDQTYCLLGFGLEPDKFDLELSTKSLNQLQQYYANITSAENSEIKMEECFTELSWNYRYLGYTEGNRYNRLRFSLFRRNGLYVLELVEGDSFPERSWSKKRLEQAVAEVYVSSLTYVEVPGHPDIGS